MASWISLLYLFIFSFIYTETQLVPAIFMFGDSLVDVGNNNHLKLSLAKADFPHNGVDFPGKKPTGRFSNGRNAADFLAEKLGLQTSPPYLSLVSATNKSNAFLGGASFASGGAGILDGTDTLFRLYSLGARKLAVVGAGAIGCCPSQRNQNQTGECHEQANYWSLKYNQGFISLLQELKSELKDMNYSFFDTYTLLLNFIQKPAAYGTSK
uniref:GDSL esterase/lipase At5g55050-like n=1 Tax=Nelumbo nucifera TaxID=4432 RepID=A0A822XNW9_NELNU|nr:TPA_asm: hypothetical protein HUJ06_021918 [Nelumbo nucifera]